MKILEYCHDEDLVSFFKPRLVFLLCVFSFFAFACDHDEKHDLKTFPTEFTEGDFTLDSLAVDLRIFPLKFREPIAQVRQVKWKDPYFYISSTNGTAVNRIDIFDLNGNNVGSLEEEERGPGEYISIYQFAVDDNHSIYVNTLKKIVIYDRNQNHVRDIPWPEDLRAEMYLSESALYLFDVTYFSSSPPFYDWVVLDTLGNTLSSKKYQCYEEGPNPERYDLIVFEDDDNLYRCRKICDTIFSIGAEAWNPEFIINRDFDDGYRLHTQEELARRVRSDVLAKSLWGIQIRSISGIWPVGNKWIVTCELRYNKKLKFETLILDRANNTAEKIYQGNFERGKYSPWGIPNDWVGYGTIEPEGVARINNNNNIISIMDAVRLKDMVNSNGFRNSVPQRPEIKQKFQEIADTLTINDNPVLILLELK
jgi:hypothetical protein